MRLSVRSRLSSCTVRVRGRLSSRICRIRLRRRRLAMRCCAGGMRCLLRRKRYVFFVALLPFLALYDSIVFWLWVFFHGLLHVQNTLVVFIIPSPKLATQANMPILHHKGLEEDIRRKRHQVPRRGSRLQSTRRRRRSRRRRRRRPSCSHSTHPFLHRRRRSRRSRPNCCWCWCCWC